MEKQKMLTDYHTAAHWFDNSYILQNNFVEIDPSFIEDNIKVLSENVEQNTPKYHQYYISDCTATDVKWLSKIFDLIFGYSSVLRHYILCIPTYERDLNSTPCVVKSMDWWKFYGTKYGYKD